MALTVTVAVALGTLSTGKYIVGPGAHYGEPFDCAVREYAYEYAQHLQGWRGADKMREVFDSLELATLCNVTFDTHALPPTPKAHVGVLPTAGAVAYVAAHGTVVDGVPSLNDSGTPFQSVHHAVQAIRAERASLGLAAAEAPATIVLRRGTHYMTNTLELTPEDSHIKFMNYPGEPTAMSGAKPLRTTWKEVGKNPSDPSSGVIYSADLSGQGLVGGMPGLRVDGKRGFRASFPDRNPELSIFPDGWVTDGGDYSPPIPPAKNETYVTISSPMLHDKTMFQQYMVGVGGHCALYDPPVSYWCSEDPSGGGAFAFRVPSGLSYKGFKSYKDPTGAVVVAWRPAHWANWMFEVDSWNDATKTLGWTKGGFQGARGNNKGAEWYIENVYEELTAGNEFYYDQDTSTLFYINNETGAPSADMQFEAVVNHTIVSLKGTQSKPVSGVSFEGITFRDAAYTYMEPHGVPSGGDWGLQRLGAIFLEGTMNVSIKSCLVTRVDGNAIMVSGYNRGTVIEKNEFVWIGDSVIAAWGYTAPLGGSAGDDVLAQYKSGVDGRNGEQPRGVLVQQNFIHELGLFEKQSSPFFQAKSCQNVIHQNIMFNMPRAGINFNDGFGGGAVVSENLGYNTCRESSDHAVFNSWDRQPFLTDVGQNAPEADLNPAYNEISRNFFIGNYGASMAIDNDDGSSYYHITNNFEVYGGHKSNFGGHNKIRSGALIPYSRVYQEGLCCRINSNWASANVTDAYYNNTCIQSADKLVGYSFRYCDPNNVNNVTNLGIIHNNRLYNPSGEMTLECGTKSLTEQQFQATGADPGTTIAKTPEDAVIVNWAKALLEPLSSPAIELNQW